MSIAVIIVVITITMVVISYNRLAGRNLHKTLLHFLRCVQCCVCLASVDLAQGLLACVIVLWASNRIQTSLVLVLSAKVLTRISTWHIYIPPDTWPRWKFSAVQLEAVGDKGDNFSLASTLRHCCIWVSMMSLNMVLTHDHDTIVNTVFSVQVMYNQFQDA